MVCHVLCEFCENIRKIHRRTWNSLIKTLTYPLQNFPELIIFHDKKRSDFYSSIRYIINNLCITCLFSKTSNIDNLTYCFCIKSQ